MDILTITYTNYKGHTGERRITPSLVYFGATEWHPKPQWLLRAYDHDRQADRDFALAGFGHPSPATAVEPVGVVEQPDFLFFECPECGFDSVQKADFKGSSACPMCAGDSGHDVGMYRRVCRTTDAPEGRDARLRSPAVEGK